MPKCKISSQSIQYCSSFSRTCSIPFILYREKIQRKLAIHFLVDFTFKKIEGRFGEHMSLIQCSITYSHISSDSCTGTRKRTIADGDGKPEETS